MFSLDKAEAQYWQAHARMEQHGEAIIVGGMEVDSDATPTASLDADFEA